MARKQAKRRQNRTSPPLTLPSVRIGRLLTPLVAVGIVLATHQLSLLLLDREITSIEISGPFQRVTALQIEEAIRSETEAGFVGADLDRIREQIRALPWIDHARVARRWPGKLLITVSEQTPAAVWRDQGLLNTRGELFISDLKRLPPELPRLSGPGEQSAAVAQRYLDVRERLIPLGLDVRRVDVDARGAWEMTLGNGVDVRLGRRDVEARTELFLAVVADIVTSRGEDIEYVDLRYGNGFTIGWANKAGSSEQEREDSEGEVFAARGIE